MNETMLNAALTYAGRGWPVFPVHTPTGFGCSCSRPVCDDKGKHPRTKNGLKDATTNAATIREWWTKWPDANIGIATGRTSGLVVVDLDNHGVSSGQDTLADLAMSYGAVPHTLTASTGRGSHLFFKYPDLEVRGSAGRIGPGIDVRAEAGYVVAAPSLHANGTRYRWQDEKADPQDLPDWLLHLATTAERVGQIGKGQLVRSAAAPAIAEGTRNSQLYKVACALRGQQAMEIAQLTAVLKLHNQEFCDPPLPEIEVERIAVSASQHPPELGPQKSLKRMEQNPLYWWQFNTRNWFASQNVALMTDAQTGWYIRLLAFAWDQGGFLTADTDKLWRLAKAKSKRAFQCDCELVLAEFEKVEEGGVVMLRHSKMASDYSKTLADWMKKKEAGEASKVQREMARIGPQMIQ